MVGCKKCADKKEEIKDLRWEVKDLEQEIYGMKKTPCGNGSCKMIAHHSVKCYWMNHEDDQERTKTHEAKIRIEKLIKHINVVNDYMVGRIDEMELKQVWDIGRAQIEEYI